MLTTSAGVNLQRSSSNRLPMVEKAVLAYSSNKSGVMPNSDIFSLSTPQASFRLFKPFNPEKYGVYIDAGIITLRNPEKAVLIGRTNATINCDTLERHEIFLLHGAKAFINASGWAVVSVKGSTGCQQIRNVSGNAVIL